MQINFKKLQVNLQYAVIALLLAIIIISRECHRCPEQGEVIAVKHTIDTVFVEKTRPAPTPEVVKIEVPASIDTVAVLTDYFSHKKYVRTLVDDSLAKITLIDTVAKNGLLNYTVQAQFYRHSDSIFVSSAQEPVGKRKLFVGLNFGYGENPTVVPTLLFQTKKDHTYSVGYDPFTKNVQFGLYYKLRFRK